jgi:hypothetical protein
MSPGVLRAQPSKLQVAVLNNIISESYLRMGGGDLKHLVSTWHRRHSYTRLAPIICLLMLSTATSSISPPPQPHTSLTQ